MLKQNKLLKTCKECKRVIKPWILSGIVRCTETGIKCKLSYEPTRIMKF